MRGCINIPARTRSTWKAAFIGVTVVLHTVSAAPLNFNIRDGSEVLRRDSLDRRLDGGYTQSLPEPTNPQNQQFNPPSIVYGTLISSATEPSLPTTTIIAIPTTSIEAVPITTNSDSTSTPSSTSSQTEITTTSEELTSTSTSTDTSSSTTASTESFTTSMSISSDTISSTEVIDTTTTLSTEYASAVTSEPSETSTLQTSTAAYEMPTSAETITVTSSETSTLPPSETSATSSASATTLSTTPETNSVTSQAPTTTDRSTSDVSGSTTTDTDTSSLAGETGATTNFAAPTGYLSNSGFSTIPFPANSTTTGRPSSSSESTSEISTGFETSTSPSTTSVALVPTASPLVSTGNCGGINQPDCTTVSPTSIAEYGPTVSAPSVSTSLEAVASTVSETSSSTSSEPTGSPSFGPGFSFITGPDSSASATSTSQSTTETTESSSTSMATSELYNAPSTTVEELSTTSSEPTEMPTTTEISQPSGTEPGGPDIVLPSSTPNGYMPEPSYGNNLPGTTTTNSEPQPTSDAIVSSASDTLSSTVEGPVPTPDVTTQPTAYIPTGTPGSPPDLIVPTTTSEVFGTNPGGNGGGQETLTLTSIDSTIYTTATSVITLSSSPKPTTVPPPTTVYVTVVVPTAPTATVTETVYPSVIMTSDAASETAPGSVALTTSYGTAIPTTVLDIVTPTSMTQSYGSGPVQSSVTLVPTSESAPLYTTKSSTSVRPTTTELETITITNTENVIVTSYSTVTATIPETLPVPTDSDILTTVFETATAVVTTTAPARAISPAPDFGNVISVTMTASYPVPLLPLPANSDVVPITTTIQVASSYQRVELPASSASFTNTASTMPSPNSNADVVATGVPAPSEPVRSGYVIPTGAIIIPKPGKRSVNVAHDNVYSTALPTTLSRTSYAPKAIPTAARNMVVPFNTRSNATKGLIPLGSIVAAFVIAAMSFVLTL